MAAPEAEWYEIPDLVGDHVRLVRLREDHADGVLQAAADDEVFRWLTVRRPTDAASARDLVQHYLLLDGVLAWAQMDRSTGALAGMTTFYDIDPVQRTVAIGHTWLGRRFWNTGINTEAKILLLERAFDRLGCVRVAWHTDINNHRSQAAIERLGAQREGVLRKHKRRPDGSWRDTVVFAMTDDEWPAAREQLDARLRSAN